MTTRHQVKTPISSARVVWPTRSSGAICRAVRARVAADTARAASRSAEVPTSTPWMPWLDSASRASAARSGGHRFARPVRRAGRQGDERRISNPTRGFELLQRLRTRRPGDVEHERAVDRFDFQGAQDAEVVVRVVPGGDLSGPGPGGRRRGADSPREQRSPQVAGNTPAFGHACQAQRERRREGVGQQHAEIESARGERRGVPSHPTHSASLEGHDFVHPAHRRAEGRERGRKRQRQRASGICVPRRRNRRNGHHDVTEPVRRPDHDSCERHRGRRRSSVGLQFFGLRSSVFGLSRATGYRLRTTGRSMVGGRWSLVAGLWSLVFGLWSLVLFRTSSLVLRTSQSSLAPAGNMPGTSSLGVRSRQRRCIHSQLWGWRRTYISSTSVQRCVHSRTGSG